MKDNLENFISQNRDEFDMFEPSNKMWEKIEGNIERQAKTGVNWKRVLSRAAVVLVIFASSLVTYEFLEQRGVSLMSSSNDKSIEIPELKEAEHYYSVKFSEKLDEAKPFLSENPKISEGLMKDLAELDSIYNGLKKELTENVATEDVVEALIQNYRLRIDILEDLMSVFEEKEKEEESREQNKTEGYEI
jgi:hypothetical protein